MTVEARALEDAVLVAQVRARDPLIAEAFCVRVLPTVDRTVRRLLGRDDADLDDITQIAIIEVVRSIGGFRTESSLDTWVAAVTGHVVYKYIRRNKLKRHIPLDLVQDELLPRSHVDAENVLAGREVLARILRHLDNIGEKLACSFVLHDVLGHQLEDVARLTGVSIAAAQSRLVRGRHRLHARIAKDPELSDLFRDFDRGGKR